VHDLDLEPEPESALARNAVRGFVPFLPPAKAVFALQSPRFGVEHLGEKWWSFFRLRGALVNFATTDCLFWGSFFLLKAKSESESLL
jgi:hypothetical protein